MAQRQDKLGRLSMKALSDIATKTENNNDKSVDNTREENRGKLKDDLTKRKAKRPTREVYRPGISRLSRRTDDRGEDRFKKSASGTDGLTSDDESYRDSKESSMEKEMEGFMGSLNSLYIRGSNSLPRRGSQPIHPDPRKTSTLTYKKPEIPRYIPRAKLLEQSYRNEDKSPDIEHRDLLSPSGFRKVDIKSDLNKMVVTVVNDQVGAMSSQLRRNHPQTLNLQFTEKADRYYRNEDGFRSPKHRGSIDLSRDEDCETPTSPGLRMYRYKFEGIRKGADMSRDDDCDSVSSQNQRQSKRRSYTKSKHYTSQYRRQRTGSISSEFSAASDASVDDTNGRTYDWDEEVEREMSKSVNEEFREETQKLQQMTEKMQNMDCLNTDGQAKSSVSSGHRARAESSGSNFSEQPLQGRSRKRDRRKIAKPKTESRDSSLQSNPSKDLMPSHCGDTHRRGKGRGRRRRTNKESPQSSAFEADTDDTWKPELRVTFGKRDRQVQMKSGPGSNQVNRGTTRNNAESSNQEKSTLPRSGGIIHLPQNVSTSVEKNQHPHNQPNHHNDQGPLPQKNSHPRPRDQGGGSKKILFDPRNPNKPIVIKNSTLKFHDPYEQSHESYPRNLPQFYSEYGYNYPDMVSYRDSPNSSHPDPYYPRYPQPTKESGMVSDENYDQDGYYHNGQEPDIPATNRSRSHCRTMAEHIFHDCVHLDGQLSNMLSRGLQKESMNKLSQLRSDLQTKCEQIILLDLDIATKQNVEQLLWKSVYYQLIEIYRNQLAEEHSNKTPKTQCIKEQLFAVLDEGTTFYEGLLERLQSTYNFSLAPFLDTNSSPPENCQRTVKLALLTAQRIMICLGDIARYRELANDSTNYGRARSWYMKAQQLAPKNGRPYNQLAILALYTKRKLDSVYYYMRSLAASNPFVTARESLMTLFDEARKKAEAAEKKRVAEKERIKKMKKRRKYQGQRREIWIAPDGSSHENHVEDSYEEDLSKLPLDKLNRRFVLSFLNVHGKLFTKIGMETFPEMCSQMLQEFQTLLQQAHPTITCMRILQLMAINMFTIENTALKETCEEGNSQSLLQEHAVQLGLDMFAILVERCAELLHNHLQNNNSPQELLSYTLSHYMPAVKVWADWMICHQQLWMQPLNFKDPDLGPNTDVWESLAKLCNVLIQVDISHVRLYKDKRENCEPVILSEDTMLCGFVPLLSAPFNATYVHCTVDKVSDSPPSAAHSSHTACTKSKVVTYYVHSTVDKDIARDCLRIQTLQMFGDYLCGIEPAMLSFNVETKQYYSVAPSQKCDEQETEITTLDDVTSEEEVIVTEEEYEMTGEEEEGVKILKAKKEELKKKVEEKTLHQQNIQMLRAKREQLQKEVEQQTNRRQNIQAILREHRTCSVEVEIRPMYLLPDTNCFIDHLSGIQKLVFNTKYTISIPLIVINELDGLVRGNLEGHYDSVEHSDMVKENAKQAMAFLEEQFEQKNPRMRAQTTKGNMLDTIVYRSEATDMKGNNDDLILTCCLHYCKDHVPKVKDAPIRLERDVVLLTDDRNLRLKAYTYNVPVKDVPSFLKWCKVT